MNGRDNSRKDNLLNYQRISDQASAGIKQSQFLDVMNTPWKFTNLLPTPIILYAAKSPEQAPGKLLGTLEGRKTKYISADGLEDRDILYTMYKNPSNGKLYIMLQPYVLHGNQRDIKLGSIVYDEYGTTNFKNTYADLPSVKIYNMLPMTIDVQYAPFTHPTAFGPVVAKVAPFDEVGYMGGGDNSVYYDNNANGLRIGDQLKFSYSVGGRSSKGVPSVNYLTVTVKDNFMKNLYVGKIDAGGYRGPDSDVFAYSAEKADTIGVTYYEPVGGVAGGVSTYAVSDSKSKTIINPQALHVKIPFLY